MLKKSLVIISILFLMFTGCSLGSNDSATAIRIVQTDGNDGVVHIGSPIQLAITPAELSDTVEWSVYCPESHPGGVCATEDPTGEVPGLISGLIECNSVNVIAETADGAVDNFSLEVKTGKIGIEK